MANINNIININIVILMCNSINSNNIMCINIINNIINVY